MDAIVSIHDVTPDTLARVDSIIRQMPQVCRRNLVLLVVPGLDWQPDGIETLRRWQQEGMMLAGHGWHHRAARIVGLKHRLHSLFISRDAAEHLSLGEREICALMQRNYDWFAANGLESPQLYVPPAWALGAVSPEGLAKLPFRYIETTGGILDTESGRTRVLPLAGFEADTRLRAGLLLLNNAANRLLARIRGPLRISIHPFDPEYYLAASMRNLLARVGFNCHFAEVFEDRRRAKPDGSL